jgi:RNA polymerase sigma factor (sigma-70 family)
MNNTLQHTAVSNDEDLIEKILAGEPALFEVLIRRYNPVLYKIARSYGFPHADAEDLMQEAHYTAYLKLAQFEHRASYKTWLSKIIINKCLYKLKYGYGNKERPDSERINEHETPVLAASPSSDTEKRVLNRELSRLLEASLQHLPLAYRTVFLLREVEGYSVQETADLLSITPVNVKVRLNRAKAMMQKQLEQYYSTADLYEFNLVYCDAIVHRVFERIYATNSPGQLY